MRNDARGLHNMSVLLLALVPLWVSACARESVFISNGDVTYFQTKECLFQPIDGSTLVSIGMVQSGLDGLRERYLSRDGLTSAQLILRLSEEIGPGATRSMRAADGYLLVSHGGPLKVWRLSPSQSLWSRTGGAALLSLEARLESHAGAAAEEGPATLSLHEVRLVQDEQALARVGSAGNREKIDSLARWMVELGLAARGGSVDEEKR